MMSGMFSCAVRTLVYNSLQAAFGSIVVRIGDYAGEGEGG